MGRPKEFDSDLVLAAATDCFWGDGVARTSISSLVEAMKIQRSSFYNSFGSREDILTTVLERYMLASPLGKLSNGLENDGTPPDLALIDFILDFTHFLANEGHGRGCLFFNGMSELSARDGQTYEIYQDHYLRLNGGLSDLLNSIQQELAQPEAVSSISLNQVLCILIGLAHFSRQDSNELRLAKVALEQISGLSSHFASLIQTQERSVETMRQFQEAERLQA